MKLRGRPRWLVPIVAAMAGCGEIPQGIIEKQRESDARNAAAAEREADAARAAEQAGTERFNVVALEAEAARSFEESNAQIEAHRAEGKAILAGKPQADDPVAAE